MDMQVNNEVSLNNEQEKNMKENSGIIEKTEKQKVMKDGKQRRDVIRYFLPVLTTIGWVIIYTIGQNSDVFVVFGFVLVCIGLLSAITVSPLQYLKFVLTSIKKGFSILRNFIPFYGVADLIAATVGTVFGFLFGVIVVICLPAIFTITKFLNEDIF